jgi:hypothetical protein
MATRKGVWIGCLLGLILGCGWGGAQTLPQTTEEALHDMAQLAGVIFAGQVVAVRRHAAAAGSTGVVEIEFAVQDAVRGVSGGSYTLREWAGLWPADDEPFRVGQRYLMLLHSPGAAGLSSPIGGLDGAIPIRGGGQAVAPAQTTVGARPRAPDSGLISVAGANLGVAGLGVAGEVVDLSWVGTRVVTPIAYQAQAQPKPIIRPTPVHAESVATASADMGEPQLAATPPAGSGSQKMAYSTVLGMLRGWEVSDHAAR